MARSSKATSAATLEKPAAPAAHVSAEELAQRTREALESTRTRLQVLAEQIPALERERDALAVPEHEALQHAADAAARALAAPERVQSARAQLMALVGSAGEASSQAAVAAAEQAQQVAEEAAREASVAAANVHA